MVPELAMPLSPPWIMPLLVSVPTEPLTSRAVEVAPFEIFPELVIEQLPVDQVTAVVLLEMVPLLGGQFAWAASGVMLASAAVKAKVSAVCLGY